MKKLSAIAIFFLLSCNSANTEKVASVKSDTANQSSLTPDKMNDLQRRGLHGAIKKIDERSFNKVVLHPTSYWMITDSNNYTEHLELYTPAGNIISKEDFQTEDKNKAALIGSSTITRNNGRETTLVRLKNMGSALTTGSFTDPFTYRYSVYFIKKDTELISTGISMYNRSGLMEKSTYHKIEDNISQETTTSYKGDTVFSKFCNPGDTTITVVITLAKDTFGNPTQKLVLDSKKKTQTITTTTYQYY